MTPPSRPSIGQHFRTLGPSEETLILSTTPRPNRPLSQNTVAMINKHHNNPPVTQRCRVVFYAPSHQRAPKQYQQSVGKNWEFFRHILEISLSHFLRLQT